MWFGTWMSYSKVNTLYSVKLFEKWANSQEAKYFFVVAQVNNYCDHKNSDSFRDYLMK